MPLDATEVHHLRVRRAGEVIPVEVRDGEGLVGAGVLRTGRGAAQVAIERAQQVARPVPLRLAVAAGDKDRFAWLVEKATELGVTDILPVETDRTAAVASRVRTGQLGRLRRRALEAVGADRRLQDQRIGPQRIRQARGIAFGFAAAHRKDEKKRSRRGDEAHDAVRRQASHHAAVSTQKSSER